MSLEITREFRSHGPRAGDGKSRYYKPLKHSLPARGYDCLAFLFIYPFHVI